jgi:hypothetical protein
MLIFVFSGLAVAQLL